jgi:precorrin-6Y C5,15-methyltransferase (decarboxylating)
MSAAGAAGLPETLLARIAQAELLAGGRRHLDYFPSLGCERLTIGAEVGPALERLRAAHARGLRTVVLASGDPLWYGIGASLRRVFPPEALEIVPAPSAAQLAFAALGEPWDGAALLSAHGRPLGDAVAAARRAARAAFLTDPQHTPGAIARALLADGRDPAAPCAVCENLGAPEQRVVRLPLAAAAEREFAPLNVFVLLGPTTDHRPPTTDHRPTTKVSIHSGSQFSILNSQFSILNSQLPGLPDAAFSTEGGQITKREVRLLSLAELALGPGEVLWDIGAGSGALAIEAARAQPGAAVYAVERRGVFVAHIRANLERFPAPNLTVAEGAAPAACDPWPDPHAVFVGGSGGRLAAIVGQARARLRPGGRLVVNLVTLEHLHELRGLLPDAAVTQVQIGRGVPIQDMLRFEALNPVFIAVWRKE